MKTTYSNFALRDDPISYDLLAKALLFYKARHYGQIETPWLVSDRAIRVTLPKCHESMECSAGALVGSGEQGFTQMMIDGTLRPGLYCTVTPCFRDEAAYNELLRQSFIKIELIWYMPADPAQALTRVLNDAMDCFGALSFAKLNVVPTADGQDIFLGYIEIGSYGIRKKDGHTWVFGTGLAEPRFSLALHKYQS